MHKLGSFRKNWLQRWFVLNEGTLQYYGAESDTKPKKLVVLNEACKFGPSTEHVEGKICFQIHYWGDSLSLYADTTEEMEEWRAYVEAHVDGIKHILVRAQPPVMRGPLHKRGEWGKWTRRWFVVTGPTLRYYTSSPGHQLENHGTIGEFDLRGAVLTTSTTALGRPEVPQAGGLAETWSDDTISKVQEYVEFFTAGRNAQLCFALKCKEKASGRIRKLNLSAENQPEFDAWIERLQQWETVEAARDSTAASSPAAADDNSSESPPWLFDKDRAQLRSITISADDGGDSAAAAAEGGHSFSSSSFSSVCLVDDDDPLRAPAVNAAAHRVPLPPPAIVSVDSGSTLGGDDDVRFLVTVEHADGVQWQLSQPFTVFEALDQHFCNADPALHRTLAQFLPRDWPARPDTSEAAIDGGGSTAAHRNCAADLQRYFEQALRIAKRLHGVQVTKVLTPEATTLRANGGQLLWVQGRLGVQRSLHHNLAGDAEAPSRWCTVKRPRVSGDRRAKQQSGGGVEESSLAACFSWALGPPASSTSTPFVSRQQSAAAEANAGARTRQLGSSAAFPDTVFAHRRPPGVVGCTAPDHPIESFNLGPATFIRSDIDDWTAGLDHWNGQMEVLDASAGGRGTRVLLKPKTQEVFAIWHCSLRQLCGGQLSQDVKENYYSVGGRWVWSLVTSETRGETTEYAPWVCERLEAARAAGQPLQRIDIGYFKGRIDFASMRRISDNDASHLTVPRDSTLSSWGTHSTGSGGVDGTSPAEKSAVVSFRLIRYSCAPRNVDQYQSVIHGC